LLGRRLRLRPRLRLGLRTALLLLVGSGKLLLQAFQRGSGNGLAPLLLRGLLLRSRLRGLLPCGLRLCRLWLRLLLGLLGLTWAGYLLWRSRPQFFQD
jgi:hypothetical protein